MSIASQKRGPRDHLIVAAATLFRRQGYAATGINEIVALSGAPKGSLYHYFPVGKEQLAEEALHYSAAKAMHTFTELRRKHRDPAMIVAKYFGLLKEWMAKSGWKDGCPIATVILEVGPGSDRIAAAGASAFEAWADVFASSLEEKGVTPDRAKVLGSVAVSALEGGLVQCKAARSGAPLDHAAQIVIELFRSATAGAV